MPDISRLVIEVNSAGVVQATGNLAAFEAMSKKVGNSSKSLGKEFGTFQLIVDKLPGPMKSIASGLMGIVSPATAAVSALLEVGGAAKQFIDSSLDAYGQFELIQKNLEITMGSAEKARDIFSEIQDFAMETPFDLNGTAQAVNMLKQAGVETSNLISTLEILGNVSGGNMERFNRIAYNYVQVLQKGVLDARDTKEFAGNLVPINKALQDIGITGTATADDMVEAFRYMTQEGSMFYDAINKQADTYIGKTNQAQEAWIAFKAAVADNSGLGEAAKGFLSSLTETLNTLTYTINGNIDFFGNAKRDNYKSEEAYGTANIEKRLSELNKDLDYYEKLPEYFKLLSGVFINSLEKEKTELEEQKSVLQEIVNLQNQRTNSENEFESTLEKSIKDYADLQAAIKKSYAETEEGQREELETQIKIWQERLKATHLQGYDKWGTQTDDKSKISYYEELGISDEGTKHIEAIIKMLLESLDKAGKKSSEVKHEFADWVELLSSATGYSEENVELWKGLGTVEKYAAEGIEAVRDRFLAATPEGGFIYEALGLNKADVYQNAADQMKSLVEMMTNARIKEPWSVEKDASYQEALKLYAEYKNAAASTSYEDAIKELDIRRELIGLAKEEAEIRELTEQFGGDRGKATAYYEAKKSVEQKEQFTTRSSDLQKEIAMMKEYGTAYQEQMKLQEYTDLYGEGNAEKIIEWEKERDAVLALNDALNQLKEAGIQLAAGGLVSFANDLGAAFRDGAISGDEFSGAIRNMLRSMIDAMPQLLLNVGLQLVSKGQWAAGLAFIGASGLMSFVSGMIGDAEQDSKNDELERLKRIQEQISDLIDAQRKQQEYYLTKKRNIDSTSVSVNDAIITPRGIVYTHPEDYIIATKHPETLTGGGGIAPVNITVVNNAGAKISQQETIGANGARDIQIMVDNIVKNSMATGKYNDSFNAMQVNMRGKGISS